MQRFYARLAGFLFLWLIATLLTGSIVISRILGAGPFAEIAKRAAASERLYRLALSAELIESFSVVLLAFALYVTLKPVDAMLAQFAMYWRFGEAFIGAVSMIFGFVKLHLYTAAQPGGGMDPGHAQALLSAMRQVGFAAYNIGAIFFSFGSLLFFYLFYKSRYIPRPLSAIGVFASALVPVICFGTLIFPEHGGVLQYGWAPMAVAEVVTGFWLMLAPPGSASNPAGRAANLAGDPSGVR
jgi:hypothetical protein